MKTRSKFSSSNPDLHLQSDHKITKWMIQSVVILLLLSITAATIMVFHFTKNTTEPQPPPNAEKLVSPEIITDQLNQQNTNIPEGFKNELKGPRPSRFARTTENPVVITQRHPKNIQEIIDHLQDGGAETSSKRPDPFFLYKPENPSDVNLLALNNVRFAPPVWADFRNVGAKRRVEERSNASLRSKENQILRSEILLPSAEWDGGVPRTFVRLNVYSNRHKKRNSKVIFPSRK